MADSNTQVSMEALKPCPFCGDEAQPAIVHGGGIEWAQVECVNRECGAVGPTPATEAEAITAWNTRSDQSALAEREACAKVADDEAAKANKYYEAKLGGDEGMNLNQARYRTAVNISTAIRERKV